MTLPPEEAKRLFRVSRDLFSEPGVADRADELTAEACRLAGKRMATISALRFLAARGNEEAKGFLAALEYPYARPLLRKRDVKGTIWVCQWVGQEIRVLDYLEGQGQVLGYYTNELHQRDYNKAICHLPHDGVNTNSITGLRYADHLRDAGFKVEVIPNQGSGAAAIRIESVWRLFPKCWFNEATTEAGRDALGFYHEKKDEQRDVGLGPEHDWSSHAADAFGLMAIAYEEPSRLTRFNRKIEYPQLGIV